MAATLSKRKLIEPWFIPLAQITFTTCGIVPMLLPLAVVAHGGDALKVGLILSANGAGMLTAPLWGGSADRYRCHRLLMVVAPLWIAISLLGFARVTNVAGLVLLGFLQGCGVAAAFTVANLLIACCYPPDETADRIGWMQTVVSGGTVVGLVAAGALSRLPLDVGFLAGAIVTGLAALIFLRITPTPPKGSTWRSMRIEMERQNLREKPFLPFFLLLSLWFVGNFGMFGFMALYPLVMSKAFGVRTEYASFVAAGASLASTALFVRASLMTARWGSPAVLAMGLLWRAVALAAMVALMGTPTAAYGALGLYFLITMAWPLLSVSSTELVNHLTSRRGDGLGLYSGSEAAGHLIGPIVAGQLADRFGYDAVVTCALACVLFGLPMALGLARLARGVPRDSGPLPALASTEAEVFVRTASNLREREQDNA